MAAIMYRNFVGAFSDAAVLFPLLILLGQKTSFQFPVLFLSAGLLAIVSGIYFRVPMAVQPLKSIAIAAISVGASASEIQMSTLLLSIVFFIILITRSESWLHKVPESWIHTLQFSLGTLLLCQALDVSVKMNFGPLIVLVLSVVMIYLVKKWDWPLLGILATIFLSAAIFTNISWLEPKIRKLDVHFGLNISDLRWPLVLNLLLPQLALTMANSVIATENVSKRYFGDRARLVTTRRLLTSISTSNLFSAVVGGLPMCHGSGGVTALYRGGARNWKSNFYLGALLLFLATLSMFYDLKDLQFSPTILSSLLAIVGFYHLLLAKATWQTFEGKIRILLAAATVLLTRNLLVVLFIQILISTLFSFTPLRVVRRR